MLAAESMMLWADWLAALIMLAALCPALLVTLAMAADMAALALDSAELTARVAESEAWRAASPACCALCCACCRL